MTAGAAITVIGWWTGFKLGGLVLLNVADSFEASGDVMYWQNTFIVMIGLMVVMNIGLMLIPENPLKNKTHCLKIMQRRQRRFGLKIRSSPH